MKKINNFIKICLLFLLLFIVALLPVEITSLQNKRLIHQVYTADISKEEQNANKSLHIKEKFAIIMKSARHSVLSTNNLLESAEHESLNEVIKQLKLLEKKNVIPPIKVDNDVKIVELKKTTYFDIDEPLNVVNIEELCLKGGSYTIWVSMDMETAAIYRIVISSKEELPEFQAEFNPVLYMDYLGLPLNNISVKGNNSRGWINYTDEILQFSYEYNRENNYLSFELVTSENIKDSDSNPKKYTMMIDKA